MGNVPTCQLPEIFPEVKQATPAHGQRTDLSTSGNISPSETVDPQTKPLWKCFHNGGDRKTVQAGNITGLKQMGRTTAKSLCTLQKQ